MKTAAIATNIILLGITYCVCVCVRLPTWATDYYNVLRFGYNDSVDQFETKVHDSQSHDRIDGHASCIWASIPFNSFWMCVYDGRELNRTIATRFTLNRDRNTNRFIYIRIPFQTYNIMHEIYNKFFNLLITLQSKTKAKPKPNATRVSAIFLPPHMHNIEYELCDP